MDALEVIEWVGNGGDAFWRGVLALATALLTAGGVAVKLWRGRKARCLELVEEPRQRVAPQGGSGTAPPRVPPFGGATPTPCPGCAAGMTAAMLAPAPEADRVRVEVPAGQRVKLEVSADNEDC